LEGCFRADAIPAREIFKKIDTEQSGGATRKPLLEQNIRPPGLPHEFWQKGFPMRSQPTGMLQTFQGVPARGIGHLQISNQGGFVLIVGDSKHHPPENFVLNR
jgi:hypothetical protein